MIDMLDKWGPIILLGGLFWVVGICGYVECKNERDSLKIRNNQLEDELFRIRIDYRIGLMNWQLEQVRILEEKEKIKDSLYNAYYGK